MMDKYWNSFIADKKEAGLKVYVENPFLLI